MKITRLSDRPTTQSVEQWAEIAEQVIDSYAEKNRKLTKALAPFAMFACSGPGECKCHNCVARDLLADVMA